MIARLPGACVVCRRPVWWGGKSWREGTRHGVRHVCPSDRPTCGAWMRYARERCARRPGHTTAHRTQYALDNAMRAAVGRRRAA